MTDNPSPPLRHTQRAPQSCVNCARRKVRCSKRFPCNHCIRRGEAADCMPERVIVTSQSRSSPKESVYAQMGYEDMIYENLRLQSLLVSSTNDDHDRESFTPSFAVHEHIQRLFDVSESYEEPGNTIISDESLVILPSRSVSDILIQWAGEETSWNNFATHSGVLSREHEEFWIGMELGSNMPSRDPGWMALYFSLLAASVCLMPKVATSLTLGLTPTEVRTYRRHWFDAAMFYLHKADFLRKPHLRTVQAIAVLRDVCTHVGEANSLATLWPIAIRTAQRLGLHDETMSADKSSMEAEIHRRLWWTLIAFDWLSVPYRTPIVQANDFAVQLPTVLTDDEVCDMTALYPADCPRPIHWQVTLIQGARIHHKFHKMIRNGYWSESNAALLAQQTDEELARLVGNLPSWFQAESDAQDTNSENPGTKQGWIDTQRLRLYLMVYEGRRNINATLLNLSDSCSDSRQRARSICLSSCRTTLQLSVKYTNQVSDSWFNIVNIYSAIMYLVTEVLHPDDTQGDRQLTRQGLAILESLAEESRLAAAAVDILRPMVLD